MSRSTDASIAFSVTDNLSASVVKMKNALGGFRDDAEGLQKQLDILQNTRMQLKNIDLKNAKNQVDQMRRALEDLGDTATEADRAAARADFDQAVQNYSNVENQLKLVSRQANATWRDLENATDAISKTENRAASVSGGGSKSAGGILSALGTAGLLNMAGDVALDVGNLLVGSGFGSETGSLVSSGVSGALSGAAMGSLLPIPVIGTAVGAAIGGGLGLLQGGTQAAQEKDEAFKQYYIDQYDQVAAATDESLSGGGDTASQRELDAIAFERLLGEGTGEEFLQDLRRTAAETPMEYDDLTGISRALATGFGDAPERMLELIEAIGDAGSAVGVTASDMEYMAQSMSRMQSSGKATLEYLNIFQDRGVDVIGMLSEAMGKTQGEIYDMISKGSISGQDAVDIIQQGMESMYGGAMETMSQTFDGLTSTLSDAMTKIDNAMGEGYNEKAKEGLQADIDAYGGALGEAMAQANSIIGEGRAIAENLSRQYDREAMAALTQGAETTVYSDEQAARLQAMHDQYTSLVDQYQTATEEDKAVIAAQIEALMEDAQAMAESNYNASETAQQLREVELDQIAAIRENTAALGEVAWSGDYERQQEQSKGAYGDFWETDYIPGDISYNASLEASPSSNAFGLDRVPYDGYPAVLHEGERVLTAREAREMDRELLRKDDPRNTDPDLSWDRHAFGADRTESLVVERPAAAAETGGVSPLSYWALMVSAAREPAPAAPGGDAGTSISITVTGNTFGAGLDEAAVAEAIADTAVRKILAGFQGST